MQQEISERFKPGQLNVYKQILFRETRNMQPDEFWEYEKVNQFIGISCEPEIAGPGYQALKWVRDRHERQGIAITLWPPVPEKSKGIKRLKLEDSINWLRRRKKRAKTQTKFLHDASFMLPYDEADDQTKKDIMILRLEALVLHRAHSKHVERRIEMITMNAVDPLRIDYSKLIDTALKRKADEKDKNKD